MPIHGGRIRSVMRSPRVRVPLALLATAMLVQSCSAGGATARTAATRPVRPGPAGPGQPVWRHVLPGWPSHIVADWRSLVVSSSGTTVTDLESDGTPRWSEPVEGLAETAPGLSASLVVVAGTGRLVALDRSDGTTRWQADVPSPVRVVAVAEARGRTATVVNSTDDGHLEGRNGSDGSTRWRVGGDGQVHAQLALSEDRDVVVALWSGVGSSTLRALDVDSGSVIWERRVARYASAPAITKGMVVLGAGDNNYRSQVLAFALADSAPVWDLAVPASFESSIEPGTAGSDVVFIDHFGTVTFVDGMNARIRWQQRLGSPVLFGRPVVADDVVVLTTMDHDIVWLDRATGRVIMRWKPGPVPAAIAVAEGRLVVALRLTEPGRVEAYPL